MMVFYTRLLTSASHATAPLLSLSIASHPAMIAALLTGLLLPPLHLAATVVVDCLIPAEWPHTLPLNRKPMTIAC